MVREDLIEGAISFLQDPSVASAPIDQRIAFLRSKNLTQDEIDASLARVGQSPPSQTSTPSPNYASQSHRQPPPQYAGAYQYQNQQQPYWPAPPPELPRRDWRDWFIMATVVGGVGYAMYWTAARYITPLLLPPTPPQLEQDKASIDTSFDKAFALLDQLATDTAELKESEKTRTERLDAALAEVESVVGLMKAASETREQDAKKVTRELAEIRDLIPKAIEREREGTDGRLRDLGGEMRSLKTLVGNRMAPPPTQQKPAGMSMGSQTLSTPAAANEGPVAASQNSTPAIASQPNGMNGVPNGTVGSGEKPASVLPDKPASPSPYGRTLGGKAQIPSWQLAAKKRSEEAKKDAGSGSGAATPQAQDVTESGTVEEVGANA